MATTNEEILKVTLQEYVELLRADFASQNVNATGKLSNSLRVEVTNNLGKVFGLRYVATVEDGRGPTLNKSGGGGPTLVDLIRDWIAAKGLDLNEWAVAKSIHKKGTLMFQGKLPPGRQQADLISKNFQTVLQQLRAKVLIVSRDRLRSDILKRFKPVAA